MRPSAPSPTDHAATQRALASLTATLGAIALRIETHQHEEHREGGDECGGQDASAGATTPLCTDEVGATHAERRHRRRLAAGRWRR
jgi:hypothetical protein